jgi:hypothetical protein
MEEIFDHYEHAVAFDATHDDSAAVEAELAWVQGRDGERGPAEALQLVLLQTK